jgi:rhamnosyltransferase
MRVDRLAPDDRDRPAVALLGHRGFFTDANGCVARWAWERFPFRAVAYAEDHLLAQDMLRGGLAKVFVPDAAVIHSHEYTPLQWLRRSFDEARAVRDVYGWAEPASPRVLARNLWGRIGADWRWIRAQGHADGVRQGMTALSASAAYHGTRIAGAVLGARADRLPAGLVRYLSLEGRGR